MITIHGIKNCDTVKKARAWLSDAGIEHRFHDYKIAGIDAAMIRDWVARVGWEPLLNRSGTTFRNLPDADKAAIDAEKAIALMLAQPAMIKRPVLLCGDRIVIGFKPDEYRTLLG